LVFNHLKRKIGSSPGSHKFSNTARLLRPFRVRAAARVAAPWSSGQIRQGFSAKCEFSHIWSRPDRVNLHPEN